jgi:primosomal protein N' (replication factor Y) (superfamily II helicase)
LELVDVAIDSRSGGGDAVWTYGALQGLQEGDAVLVPLGTRSVVGFVMRRYTSSPRDLGFPVASLRYVQERISGLSLPPQVLTAVEFVSKEYLTPLSVAIGPAAPPGIRDRLVTAWKRDESAPEDVPLTPLQKEVLRVIDESGGMLIETKTKKLPGGTARALKLLRSKGIVRQETALQPSTPPRKPPSLLRLTSDSEKIETFLKKEGKRKPAQAITIMRLQTAEAPALLPSEIKALSGVTETTLKALVDSGLLEKIESEGRKLARPPIPNPYQDLAIEAVAEAIRARSSRSFLLFGITGSGKTEVYLRAAAEALRQGRQVLYLVPEIALATQAISQLHERFGGNVAVLHSELPAKERLENWLKVRGGEAPVVLGARSALFAPMANLGLIIMDEEHETSYKQESSPRYHAKAVAKRLAEVHGCPLVLGSATPSIETFFDAETDVITLLSLPERAAAARLPQVHIENLAEGYQQGRPAILGPELLRRMDETLAKGQQVILFLNRRAYSPFLVCRDCGEQFKCPNCAVSLAFSRRDGRLRCHHCGYYRRPPEICPSCKGHRINPLGIGTEKVEEIVSEAFPNSVVARLDRDVARKKGALEETLARFRSGEVGILVGTQMVAKGLDFPNVTLVGVIAADLSLNIPDFRAGERTFQLLSQVAGRAGRGSVPGHVVIQTFNPEHVAITCAQDHNYVRFYEATKVERMEAGYPPFKRLVNVVVSSENLQAAVHKSDEAADALRQDDEITLLGPADCAIERLQGRWRRHMLLKLRPEESAASVGEKIGEVDDDKRKVSIVIDVDPYSLL